MDYLMGLKVPPLSGCRRVHFRGLEARIPIFYVVLEREYLNGTIHDADSPSRSPRRGRTG